MSMQVDDALDIEATLHSRAQLLADTPRLADQSRTIEVLVCRLGVEEYAVELRLLHGVLRAISLTPVPCTPPFVSGLLNLRGEILTVLNLSTALGLLNMDEHTVDVLLVDTQQVRVGFQVDEVLDVRRIALDSLDHALGGNTFTRGIANARTVLLDLEALLADSRFEMPEDTR